jgi:hypothetical protein
VAHFRGHGFVDLVDTVAKAVLDDGPDLINGNLAVAVSEDGGAR